LSFLAVLLTGAATLFAVSSLSRMSGWTAMTSMYGGGAWGETDTRRSRLLSPHSGAVRGPVDYLSGRPASVFGRDGDGDLVRDSDVKSQETTISLRRRDLRYGVFDRSDLHLSDLTGASATGASFRETNLRAAKAERADMQNADLWQAHLAGSDFRGSNLRNALFQEGLTWQYARAIVGVPICARPISPVPVGGALAKAPT
jgi:hypothetical protein